MRIYVSSGVQNAAEAKEVAGILEACGHEITDRWWEFDHIVRTVEWRRDRAEAEISAVQRADALVVILPGGRGTHVELGAMLALGKLVHLRGPKLKFAAPDNCLFYSHPLVTLHTSLATIISALQ